MDRNNFVFKSPVYTFSEISKEYSCPEENWAVTTTDSNITYVFKNGKWESIGIYGQGVTEIQQNISGNSNFISEVAPDKPNNSDMWGKVLSESINLDNGSAIFQNASLSPDANIWFDEVK